MKKRGKNACLLAKITSLHLKWFQKNGPLVPSRRELERGNEEEELESLKREIKDVNDKLDTIERRQFRLFQFLRD